ncbi:hypothetical protein ACFVH6_25670 [Spirillospora sp. NPDC127200]
MSQDEILYAPEAEGLVATADGNFIVEDIPPAEAPARDGAGVRAARTLVQGAIFAALTAVFTLLAGTTFDADTNYKVLGLAILQVAGTAVVSYLHNAIKR